MSELDATRPYEEPPVAPAALRPLGPWSTMAWGVLGLAVYATAQYIVLYGFIYWWPAAHSGQRLDYGRIYYNGYQVSLSIIVAAAALGGVMALAVRRAGWPLVDYLALDRPRWPAVIRAALYVAVLLVAAGVLSYAMGQEPLPPYVRDSYLGARDSGPLLVAFVVIAAAPAAEEILFRGFLFRGWAASRVGIGGTILLTSAIWALIHAPLYDWFGVLDIFCIGVLFGWLRWRSGSTTLTILMHGAINLVAMLAAMVIIEWLQ